MLQGFGFEPFVKALLGNNIQNIPFETKEKPIIECFESKKYIELLITGKFLSRNLKRE